ncbi:MAG: MFS transporter [Actinomycetota bacterium]|nr:MFS transporter [Actinomycetota bacterium]MDA3015518.1 MFS transporter [Actinomycetota bacterium]MDA3028161.1 MFS transporter [Actinomycetota bacterium]
MTPLTHDVEAPARRLPARRELLAMLSALMALMAMALDLMLSAFDEMRAEFGLEPTSNEISGVVTVFFMGLAVAQFFYGPITDRYGRKPVLAASIVIYIIGGIASALAPSLGALLVARFVWGVGAAGARVVAVAVVRDLFEGVQMAQAMSQIMAVFIMVPVIAPALGAGIVAILPWQAVFWACSIWALMMWLWSRRLPETLPADKRRRLDRRDITDSYLTFFRTRTTIWYSISSVFLQSTFTMYLASSELMVSEIFGRRSWFPFVFGVTAIGFGVASLVNGKLVGIFGVQRVTRAMLGVLVAGSLVLLAIAVTANGTPSFWAFMPAIASLLAVFMFIMPNLNAEAMQPVPHIAGTVSSLSGALRMLGGSIMGGYVATQITTSVTPFAVAFVVFSVFAALSAAVARRRPSLG